MAPSAPLWAPRHAARPSLMKMTDAKGCAILLRAASAPRRPRPARPIPACIRAKSSRVSPACAAAASVASIMDRQAFSKPIRVVAGPELAAPSTSPFSASIHPPADAILAPGFIDIQVNGGGGVLLNDQPTEAGVRRIVEAHRKGGTTGCLPTLISDRSEVIERLAAVAQACQKIPGVLGFHLEGPALNRSRKGIHSEAEIRVPDRRDLAAIKSFGGRGRSIVTLAPECVPASMIDELIGAGLRIAAGHSDATT